jgi:hypothetical protein
MKGSSDDRLQRNSARDLDRLGDNGSNYIINVKQSSPDSFIVNSVIQTTRVCSFIEIAAAYFPRRLVSHNKDRHRGGVDSRQRPYTSVVLATIDDDLA